MMNVFSVQKREWIDTPTTKLTGGDVACFSEYMEMGILKTRLEEFGVWLSGALHIEADNLAFLDHSNPQLSACGFSLQEDADRNFIFRVSYTGCFVQQQHGSYVLTLTVAKRTNRFRGRPQSFTMRCPVVSVVPWREQIHCDPEFIQVTRHIPFDNLDNELHWSLSLSDHVIVALEDASLIQMNTDISGPDITVQGRRKDVLSPFKIMEYEGECLALKLVSGQYAYSMEATCPKVTMSTVAETVLHIFKRHMGLTKRGSSSSEALTVSNVSVKQTDHFTVHETSEFVILTMPTAQILQTKACTDDKQLQQPFYRVDTVLTFRETNHKMHWTMENTLPCTDTTALSALNYQHQHHSTTDKPSMDNSAVPVEKQYEAAPSENTTESPDTREETHSFHLHADKISMRQSENSSAGFDKDTLASLNVTEMNMLDLNVTTNSSVERAESAATTALPEFNTTSANEDPMGQRRFKWIWQD
ncbi:uncharacterized protein V6R79_022163 [Siganus canaliculatus]